MAVLKFRVMYEDDDTIFRDIEIKPSQTFTDLESAIILSYSLPVNAKGNFFMSNDNWQKGKGLHPVLKTIETKPAAKSKNNQLPPLVSYIDDPHQHFLYEYYGSVEFSFLIELLALGSTENSKMIYPAVIRTQGASPFKKEVLVEQDNKKKKTAAKNIIAEEAIEEDEEEEEKSPFAIAAGDEASDEELGELSDDANVVDIGDEKEMVSAKGDLEEESFDDTEDFDVDDLGDDFNEESASEEEEY